jgi:nucleotide-binding universal stress UspA family protein
MYRTIAVPLDGSPFSERALPMATNLALTAKAGIVLIRAVSVAPVASAKHETEAEGKIVSAASQYLDSIAQGLAPYGIEVQCAVPLASANQGIMREVTARHADVVVMCTHGRSGLGRWIFGSVAEGVLGHSAVPVVLVHPTGRPSTLSLQPGAAPILVPLDGSPLAEAALADALNMSRTLSAPLSLLRVIVPQIAYQPDLALGQAYASNVSEQIMNEEQHAAEDYLSTLVKGLQETIVAPRWSVRIGWPAEAILDEATRIGAELIVMATHGRSGLAEALLGNVAFDVVRRAGIPVMLVRPAKMAAPSTLGSSG